MESYKSIIKKYPPVSIEHLAHGTFIQVLIDGIAVPFRVPDDFYDSRLAAADDEVSTLEGYRLTDGKRGDLGTIVCVDSSTMNIVAELDSGEMVPLHDDFIDRIDEQHHRLYIMAKYT